MPSKLASKSRYNANDAHACSWCGVLHGKRGSYCSLKCGNAARMVRFKNRKRDSIIKRHLLSMNAELKANRLEEFK